LTEQDFLKMLAEQNYRCAICGAEGTSEKWGRLHVDHDHDTGKVRALLCVNCNHGLGKLKDDPKLLDMAAAYLRKHGRV
jgi:DNA-directed RNA polymerase subunit RPC12/RpoP